MKLAETKKSLPPKLAQAISGYTWRQNKLGFSSVRVFRLEAKNKRSLYLKIASRASKLSLRREKLRLDWLKKQLSVPEALLFAEDEDSEYLLLSEISGLPAIDDSLKTDAPRVVEQLVKGLKMIHSLPIENCPFEMRLNHKIEMARERMINNLVEEDDFDEIRLGKTAEDLFQELIEFKPFDEDLVFTHGDYCVPNIILENGKLNGFVDWADAGIADKFQDLALLSRSVRYNFGEEYEKTVFDAYGIEPDWKKIHFYRLLDEFF